MKFFTKFPCYLLLLIFLGAGTRGLANGHDSGPCPDATISYTGSPYCSNGGIITVTLTGTTGGTFSSTGGLSVDTNTGDVDLSSSTPGTYTVTYTIPAAGDCDEFTTTTDITITAAPGAGFSYDGSPYCTNGGTASVNFTGTGGGIFSSDPGLSIDASTGNINLGASTPGSYTVTYTITASGGCGDFSTTASIIVNTGPNASISYNNSSYCTNSGNASVNLSGDGGGTFSSSGGLTIDAGTGEINCSASSPGSYTINYTVSNSCGSYTASANVNIEAAPDATISYDNSPYCANAGTAYVSFSGTGGGTYSSSAGLIIDSNNGQINLSASTPGTYTVNYDVSSGNCSTTASTSVTITEAPNAGISYPSSPYCTNGGSAYVDITGTGGGVFSSDAGLAVNASTGEIDLASSTAGTYTVIYYIASTGGCGDFTTTTNVSITAAANASIEYTNSPYCSGGDTAQVAFTGTTGGTFSSSGGLSIDPNTGTVNLSASTPGSYVVTYTVTGSGGCGDQSFQAWLTIDTAPTASISYAGSPYCSSSGTTGVNLTGTGGGTFSSTNGLTIDANSGDIDLGTSNPGTYTVTYAVTNHCGSFQTSTDITINPSPSASISYDGSPYCSNAGTAGVTFNGTGGGNFSAGTGLSLNASNGDIDIAASTPGSYTVTYSVSQNGCSASATADITIVAAPAATISYGGSPYCYNTGIAGVTLLGDAGGTFSSDAGLAINSSNGDIDLGTSTPGTYTVTYTIVPSSPCGTFTTTTSITINAGIWTGAVNNDWSNAGNWCGGVPASTTDVIIPAGGNQPVLSADITVNSISLSGLIDLNGFTLTANGDITGPGTLSGSAASNLVIGGAAGNLSFTPGSQVLKDIILNAGATATLNTALDITAGPAPGSVTVNTGATLTTNDLLTLRSDANGTSRVGISAGTISGKVIVERYMPQNPTRAWHLLSVPTTGQTFFQAWQENQSAGSTTLSSYGTQLTSSSASWASNGFDFRSNSDALLTYTPAAGGPGTYSGVTNTGNAIATTSGYFLYIRGDRTATPANNTISATTLRTNGTLYQGSLAAITVPNDEFAVIGNPYASQTDFTQLTRGADIDNVLYVWDPLLTGTYGLGAFQTFTYNAGNNNYDVTPGGGSFPLGPYTNPTIESGQAFFVHASGSATNTIAFTEAAKTSGSSNVLRPGPVTSGEQFATKLYSVSNSIRNLADGTLNLFGNAYSNVVNNEDAVKMGNFGLTIGLMRNDKKLVVEKRQLIGATDTIFFNLSGAGQRQYQFEFIANALDHPGLLGKLVDSYLGTETPVNLNGSTTVDFTVNADVASAASTRFKVVFYSSAPLPPVSFTSIKANQQDVNIAVEWKVAHELNIRQYEVEHSTDGVNFSNAAIQLSTANNGTDVIYDWLDVSPVTGNNYYRVRSVAIGGGIQYSSVVKVIMGKSSPAITVYPNPVVNGVLNVQLSNQPKGNYQVRLIDQAGQVILNATIVHAAGGSTEAIAVPKNSHGAYLLEIILPDGTKKVEKVVVGSW